MCLYGHELTEDISPIEALLLWTISPRRRESYGFLGWETIKKQRAEGVKSKRCGFIGDKTPIREGTDLFLPSGEKVGQVTSGTKGPTVGKAIGMAYVDLPHNKPQTELVARVRNKELPVKVSRASFYAPKYHTSK
mmetsp:Transcript_10278/g.15649  ORF Transcript_10278/g.15649 Transcript_10278/m.15649 type:complete len:135 (-) Transcript_10278:22-426(-)